MAEGDPSRHAAPHQDGGHDDSSTRHNQGLATVGLPPPATVPPLRSVLKHPAIGTSRRQAHVPAGLNASGSAAKHRLTPGKFTNETPSTARGRRPARQTCSPAARPWRRATSRSSSPVFRMSRTTCSTFTLPRAAIACKQKRASRLSNARFTIQGNGSTFERLPYAKAALPVGSAAFDFRSPSRVAGETRYCMDSPVPAAGAVGAAGAAGAAGACGVSAAWACRCQASKSAWVPPKTGAPRCSWFGAALIP
jgi:hypothetical protein